MPVMLPSVMSLVSRLSPMQLKASATSCGMSSFFSRMLHDRRHPLSRWLRFEKETLRRDREREREGGEGGGGGGGGRERLKGRESAHSIVNGAKRYER